MKRIVAFVFLLFFLVSLNLSAQLSPITPETALREYLHNGDQSLKWEIQEQAQADGVKLYRILFTSQQWRGITWNHEMTVIVPENLKYRDALLFITGGSVKEGKPNTHKWNESLTAALSGVAKTNRALIAIVWQVPNQPLYGNLTEDALISYTLHNYLNDNDFSWPLLFPMTKSAVRAMDVVQKFSKTELRHKINQFVVSGASKRGWTT
ncbi:MAG TPA: PhoPQ-activated protein PqaA family protein, partial [Prolixibacteraceae bacterium]|nr:PhoPQ-activated protein PqaA family protein [Prolixibacteraceae bacterium]